MSGKVLGIIGAVTLAVFTVALDKYWDTAPIQGAVKGIINLPTTLVEPVGVPLWLVVVVAILLIAMLLTACGILVRRKFEPKPSHLEPPFKPAPIELPIFVTGDQKRILSFLGYAENKDSMASLKNLGKTVNLNKLNYDHAMQQLQKNSLVLVHNGYGDGPEIMLTDKGKEFIVTNRISTEWNAWFEHV